MKTESSSGYQYKISVVIPVYRVEKYLEETIQSVTQQTIGFEEHIQMILINDGSTDSSGEICEKYKEKYPDNVIYVKQENAGVSAARNNGLGYVEGKYVNFLDSDDKWEPDAYEKLLNYFDKVYDQVDVVAGRMQFFEATEEFHPLDYKFNKTRVASLYAYYDYIQLHVTSSVIKTEAIGGVRFLTELKYGEDAQFLNTIILNKCAAGFVREALHHYRKRQNGTSAIQTGIQSRDYYFVTPKYYYKNMIDQSIERYGRVLGYVQYLILYDLQWRILKPAYRYLSEGDLIRYKEVLSSLLEVIEDRLIAGAKNMYLPYKMYAFTLKYKRDIKKELVYDKGVLYFHNIRLFDLNTKNNLVIVKFMDVRNKVLYIEGLTDILLRKEDYELYVTVSGKKYKLETAVVEQFGTKYMDGIVYRKESFRAEIPMTGKKAELIFSIWYQDIYKRNIDFTLGDLCPVTNAGYGSIGGYLIRKNEKKLCFQKGNRRAHWECEKEYLNYLKEIGRKDLCRYRIGAKIIRYLYRKKKVWLISDRFEKASDNGEFFFRYAAEQKEKDVSLFFVIAKNSEDYQKMKKIGKTVAYDSWKYRLLFLISDKIISSHANEYVINAFGEDKEFMKDLYRFDYVFLQHGVTQGDISGWLNRYNKNMKMIVTVAEREREAFINGRYYYEEQVPVLTGFPRYDNLYRQKDRTEKKILVIPTWRKYMTGTMDKAGTHSVYYPDFKDTEYYKFYNGLITNERLHRVMKQYGYKGVFCLHPMLKEQYRDFSDNEYFTVNSGYAGYQEEFITGSVMVTDYSSVYFDFAYLKKPVVYAQFDYDKVFGGGHLVEEGYFDYEKDGFGPVCRTLESVIDAVIESIEHNCENKQEYLERIASFYQFFDDRNCGRVYHAVRNL